MSITILNPGMLTSVQDLGRIGYQQFGVSVSGVMDPRSASIANILVGNDEGEAVLECTMMGPHIRFDAPNIIAITGATLARRLTVSVSIPTAPFRQCGPDAALHHAAHRLPRVCSLCGRTRYSRSYGQPLNEYESKDRRLSGPQAAKG